MGGNLVVDHVSKVFYSRHGPHVALDDISLNIQPGEFVCFIGPSGCGKSTLLSLIAGLDKTDQGSIQLDGNIVEKPGADRVIVFQEHALFPWMSVEENVGYGLRCRGVPKKQIKDEVYKYLSMVRLEKFVHHSIHQLSGGMKQRIAIIRAVILSPRVLLLDEPFNALDTQTRDLLIEELRLLWLQNKNTIIFVTHNITEAVYLSDKIVLFSFCPGKIAKTFDVNLPVPRSIENPVFVSLVQDILCQLREEVEKSIIA